MSIRLANQMKVLEDRIIELEKQNNAFNQQMREMLEKIERLEKSKNETVQQSKPRQPKA